MKFLCKKEEIIDNQNEIQKDDFDQDFEIQKDNKTRDFSINTPSRIIRIEQNNTTNQQLKYFLLGASTLLTGITLGFYLNSNKINNKNRSFRN